MQNKDFKASLNVKVTEKMKADFIKKSASYKMGMSDSMRFMVQAFNDGRMTIDKKEDDGSLKGLVK